MEMFECGSVCLNIQPEGLCGFSGRLQRDVCVCVKKREGSSFGETKSYFDELPPW